MIKKIFRVIVAAGALIVALIGFLIPILPGWPFLLIAFVIFSPARGKKLFEKIKTAWNKFRGKK